MAYTDANKTEEQVARELVEQFELSKRFLDPIHERMNLQEELYRSYIDKSNYPHQARVFDPRVFRAIETITPRLVQNEPTGSFYPAEGDDIVGAQILDIMLRTNWRKGAMFEKMVRFVKSMLIFGTAFGRTYWNYEERTVKRLKPVDMNGRMVWSAKSTEKINITVADRPDFDVLNIYDCFPDPNATSMDNMRWFILRRFRSLEELKRESDNRYGVYKNLDKLEAMCKAEQSDRGASVGNAGDAGSLYFREHRRTMLQTEEFIGQDKLNKDIVTLMRFDREGNVCEIAPEYGNLVIRESENPYFHGQMPIIYGTDYVYPNELYGIGEIEPVDRLQRAINAVVNQRLDNVQLILRNMWKVRKGAGVDMHTLVSAPGNIITTEDMNAVEAVAIPDATGGTFVQTMDYLTSALQNGTGVTDYTIGLGSESNVANKTATGVRLIQQEANAQFKLKIQLLSHMVIANIADQWKDLMIQFTTDELMMRIVGKDEVKRLLQKTKLGRLNLNGEEVVPGSDEERKLQVMNDGEFAFLKIYPDDIQPAVAGDYDFVPVISTEAVNDPIAMQNNFFIALEKVLDPAFIQGLATEGKKPNFEVIYTKVFDKLNLGLEGDDLLSDIEDQEQSMMQQQQAQPVSPEETQAFLQDRGNEFPDYASESLQ